MKLYRLLTNDSRIKRALRLRIAINLEVNQENCGDFRISKTGTWDHFAMPEPGPNQIIVGNFKTVLSFKFDFETLDC